MSATKNINIQLKRDKENESKVIEFLEDKPAKFIIVEALEMYMKAYNAMKDGTGQVQVPKASNQEEESKPKMSSMARQLGAN